MNALEENSRQQWEMGVRGVEKGGVMNYAVEQPANNVPFEVLSQ